jgi:hypothetical protein
MNSRREFPRCLEQLAREPAGRWLPTVPRWHRAHKLQTPIGMADLFAMPSCAHCSWYRLEKSAPTIDASKLLFSFEGLILIERVVLSRGI